MKHRNLLILTTLAAATAGTVRADEAAAKLSGSATVASDYLFRGLSQSWGRPSVQGGAELALPNGFTAGASAASVSEHSYPGGGSELDLYASYGRGFGGDWSWRAGLYGYFYPGANLRHAGLASRSFNTVEANFALGWRFLSLKYNHALSDYFGADVEQGYRGNTRGSGYLQLDANLPLGERWNLALHAGHMHYTSTLTAGAARNPDYRDVGATLNLRFNPSWSLGVGASHASNAAYYRRTASLQRPGETRDVGGTRVFALLQAAF